MTQDAGWRLLRIGRRLERLQFLARLLARHLTSDSATQQSHIEWLLEACDSLRVYRPRYAVAPRLGPTLDLLIRDAEHPRALAFQCTRDRARPGGAGGLSALGSSEVRLDEAIPALSDEQLVALEGSGRRGANARARLASRLQRHRRRGRRSSPTASRCGTSRTPASTRRHSPHERDACVYRIRHETALRLRAATSCTHISCCTWCRALRPYQQCLEHTIEYRPGCAYGAATRSTPSAIP